MIKKIVIVFAVVLLLLMAGFAVLVFADPFKYSGVDEEYVATTTLGINSGEVLVNGSVAANGQVLKEGDVIEAKNDSDASVIFFDDSVSRLKAGTKLSLEVLDDENFEYGQSQILINLETGEVWSKVQKSTSPDMSFSVKTVSVNATIRGSVLDVLTNEKGESIVFTPEHSALVSNLDPVTGQILDRKELMEGAKAMINKERNLEVSEITESEKGAGWFNDNFGKDEKYQQNLKVKIKERQMKKAGALPGTFGYKIKNLQDKFKVAGATDKEEMRLKIAERKFAEALLLMEEGKTDLAELQMKQAESIIKELSKSKTKDIRKKIARSVQKSKRDLRQALPGDNQYKMKDFVNGLEIEISPEDMKNRLKEANLKRRMLDLYDLSKNGDKEALDKLINELKNDVRGDEYFRSLIERGIIDPYLQRILMNGDIEKIMQDMNFKDLEEFRKMMENIKNSGLMEEAEAIRLKMEEELRKQQEELQKLRDAGLMKQPERGAIINEPVPETIPEITEEIQPPVNIEDSIRLLDKIAS